MLTNKTRKGLSWAASIALATASFVGISAPANAAIGVVEPRSTDTSTTFVSGETFKVRLNGTYAASTSVSWEVTVPAGSENDYTIGTGTQSTASGKVRVLQQTGAGTPGGNFLSITKADTTSGEVIKVRAYIEGNGTNGYQSPGDEGSNELTVTFIKRTDLAPTITITSPIEGDTAVVGELSFNVNNEQLNVNSISATIGYLDGTSITTSATISGTIAAWDADDKFVLGTNTAGLVLAKDKTLTVRVAFAGTSLGSTTTNAAVIARTVGSSKSAAVVSANATEGNGTGALSRLNSAFAMKVSAKDTSSYTDTAAKAVAGAKVTVKIVSSRALSSTVNLKVNGVTYTSSAKLPGAAGIDRIATTTDANGEVLVSLETVGFTAEDTIDVITKIENRGEHSFRFTQKTAAYSAFFETVKDGISSVAAGSTNVSVKVSDQFGVAPKNGATQVRAAWGSSTRTSNAATATSSTFKDVVDGSATLTITDNGSGAGTETYTFKLATLAADGSATEATFASLPIKYTAAALVPGVMTLTASGVLQSATTKVYTMTTTTTTISNTAFFAHDSRRTSVAAPEVIASNKLTFTGTVKTTATLTAASEGIGGTDVVVSGEGLLFAFSPSTSSTVYGVGSLTLKTDNTGAYSFDVWSNKAGKQTVTVKAGSVTSTLVIDKYSKVDAFTGKTLTVTAPTSVLPGSTLQVSALLTDKWGNPVQTDNENPVNATATSSLKVTYVGPGLQVGTPSGHTDEDGVAKLSYFLGANDSGTAKVTFSYDQNGDGDYTDTTDIVVTKDIIIGAAPVAPAAAKLTVGSFKGFLAIYASGYEGKKLSYKVAGKWGSVASLKAFERVVRKTGAGYTVKVDLYVDGSLVKSETVTTK